MTVGEAMKQAREKAGLTQNALATITGISPTSLNQYERDVYLPRIDAVEMLADTLGISIDEYVGHGTGEVKTIEKIEDRLINFIDTVKKEMAGENNE